MATEHKPNFIFDHSIAGWDTNQRSWLVENGKDKIWNGLATANIVFNEEDKILLVQRAAHDSKPGQWEVPGGAVDDEDTTIIQAAARELFEEAGLVARRYIGVVGEGPGRPLEQTIENRNGIIWSRFTFIAEVEDSSVVKIDANEHQDYLWATKKEIKAMRVGDRRIPLTSRDVQLRLLEAIRLREESKEETAQADSTQ